MTDWKAFLDGILTERQYKLDEPMNRHTTYGIGGPADCFVMPQTTEELKKVLSKAHEEGIPVTFIGGGSNLLVSDLGIRGITVCTSRLKQDMTCHETWITAMGGVGTGTISRFAEKNSLKGFEWAVGIPGTLCGAVFMNANGYGSQMKNVVEEVYTISSDGTEDRTYGWDDLHYGDSDSVFMHNGDIIVGAKLHLAPGNADEIKRNMTEHQISRRTKQPLEKRSAGTMYLRPPGYHVGPMIKDCGLIGFSIGDAQVSTKHPDFVVNNGHATCKDVLAVLHEVQKRIMDNYHIHVPLDVRILGEGVKQER